MGKSIHTKNLLFEGYGYFLDKENIHVCQLHVFNCESSLNVLLSTIMIFHKFITGILHDFMSSLFIRCDFPVLSLQLGYFLNFNSLVNFDLIVSWHQAYLNPLVIFWSQNWIRVVLTFTIIPIKVMISGGVFISNSHVIIIHRKIDFAMTV